MTDYEFSAGAFIYRKESGKILFLVLQKSKTGEYDLPKGHIEKGETSKQAAIREIKEETGLDVDLIPFFHKDTKYFFYNGKTRILKSVRFFLAETSSKKVEISPEHKGYEWVDYDQAIEKLKYRDLVRLMPQVADYIERVENMGLINEEYSTLPNKIKGWDLSRRLVPGEGRLDAEIVLVGQAPGANEDELLRPFIGRSGKLLDSVMQRARLNRADTYILSTVQFFPPKNRMPTPKEVELCRPFFERQLKLIKPKFIVLLGNLAASTVIGIGQVERNHGKIVSRDGIKYLITFHPAAALRFNENIALMDADFKKLKNEIKKEK